MQKPEAIQSLVPCLDPVWIVAVDAVQHGAPQSTRHNVVRRA
jgi:hypothetical protein